MLVHNCVPPTQAMFLEDILRKTVVKHTYMSKIVNVLA